MRLVPLVLFNNDEYSCVGLVGVAQTSVCGHNFGSRFESWSNGFMFVYYSNLKALTENIYIYNKKNDT